MGQEQRRFERIPVSFNVQCRRSGALAESWQQVATIDFSAGGLGFQSDEPFEVGETLDVRIHLESFPEPLAIRGCIVRTYPLPVGARGCALEFLEMTPDQQARLDELVQFLRKRS